MGLTHSWLRPTELSAGGFAAAVRDIRRVLKTADIPLAGFEGRGQPVFLNDAIVFNGVAETACEPFEIHQIEFDRRGRAETFSFCKTQGHSYDVAVKVALIVFKNHLGRTIKIMSDEPDNAWSQARQLVHQVTGFGDDFKLEPTS
jgi:hypothetical protein